MKRGESLGLAPVELVGPVMLGVMLLQQLARVRPMGSLVCHSHLCRLPVERMQMMHLLFLAAMWLDIGESQWMMP